MWDYRPSLSLAPLEKDPALNEERRPSTSPPSLLLRYLLRRERQSLYPKYNTSVLPPLEKDTRREEGEVSQSYGNPHHHTNHPSLLPRSLL